jgi:hypothetical protein
MKSQERRKSFVKLEIMKRPHNHPLADPATLEGKRGEKCNLSSGLEYPEMQNPLGGLMKTLVC